jgi:putative membrane protein
MADEFTVRRHAVARYFYWQAVLGLVLGLIWFFGAGLALAILYAVTLGRWLPQRQADALKFRIEGATLRADSGVYFLKRKAVPLDRVTDFALVQGPLMRWCGIWALNVQTAGAGGQPVAEAVLYGLEDPEGARDRLLKLRDEAVGRNPR